MSFIPTAKGLVYNMDSFRTKRMLRIHALSACTHKHIFAYIHWWIRHNEEIFNISEYGSKRFVTQPPVNHSLTIKPLDYKNNGSYATVINLLSKDF